MNLVEFPAVLSLDQSPTRPMSLNKLTSWTSCSRAAEDGSRVFWIMIEVTNLLQISEGFLGKPQPTHENKGKHKGGGVCAPSCLVTSSFKSLLKSCFSKLSLSFSSFSEMILRVYVLH